MTGSRPYGYIYSEGCGLLRALGTSYCCVSLDTPTGEVLQRLYQLFGRGTKVLYTAGMSPWSLQEDSFGTREEFARHSLSVERR